MGYTHYWEPVGSPPTDKQWDEIQAAAREVVQQYIDLLCWERDEPERPPEISTECIRFNGKGEDGLDTFVINRKQKDFDFCKTARKPYDAAVVAVLRAVRRICPNWLRLASDGDVLGGVLIFP